jgi:hypothetical protein
LTIAQKIIVDFSKAFDKVSHNLLTHKLHYYIFGFSSSGPAAFDGSRFDSNFAIL